MLKHKHTKEPNELVRVEKNVQVEWDKRRKKERKRKKKKKKRETICILCLNFIDCN